MTPSSVKPLSLLNFFWVPLNFQASAILAIAVPAQLLRIAGINHTHVLAILASIVAAIAMVIPVVAGAISDWLRRRGAKRRPMIMLGAAINIAGLVWLALAGNLHGFAAALMVVILGQNISLAAYQ